MTRHIIKAQQFDEEKLSQLFQKTLGIKNGDEDDDRPLIEALRGKVVASLFYEPSTRTRLSFESAALRLGAQIITTENAREFSSAAKGETLEDTIRVISGYADAIILRHYEEGASKKASLISSVPIINAGDGPGQHPTQALLDAFTIYEHFKTLNGLRIQFIGDMLNGRTVRSLVYLMSKFSDNHFIFVSPESLRMKDDIISYLEGLNISFEETTQPQTNVDVTYVTRIQKERFVGKIEDYNKVFGIYIIDQEFVSKLPKTSIVMHPLPRVNEIAPEVDDDPRAIYFQQAKNGLYLRMALLLEIFDQESFLFQ